MPPDVFLLQQTSLERVLNTLQFVSFRFISFQLVSVPGTIVLCFVSRCSGPASRVEAEQPYEQPYDASAIFIAAEGALALSPARSLAYYLGKFFWFCQTFK